MIAIPGNVRVWLATGHTDMRRGFPSLARLVQESLKRDPHAGDLYVFRGRRGGLIKIIWHDGHGACLLRHLSSLRRLRARLFKKRKFSRKNQKISFRREVIRDLELDQARPTWPGRPRWPSIFFLTCDGGNR